MEHVVVIEQFRAVLAPRPFLATKKVTQLRALRKRAFKLNTRATIFFDESQICEVLAEITAGLPPFSESTFGLPTGGIGDVFREFSSRYSCLKF